MSERFSEKTAEDITTRQNFIDLVNQHIDVNGNTLQRVKAVYVKGELAGIPTETITFARHLVKNANGTYYLEYVTRIARHFKLFDKDTGNTIEQQSAVRLSLPYGVDGEFSIEGIELIDPRTTDNLYIDETLGRISMLKLFDELA